MPAPKGALVLEIIREIDSKVDGLWNYVEDVPGRDTWRSFADKIDRGEECFGDCDDKASTALHLAVNAGVPKERLVRVIVDSTGAGKPDHFTGCYEDDDGHWWLIGDTAYLTRPIEHTVYEIHRYSRLSEGTQWREAPPEWRQA